MSKGWSVARATTERSVAEGIVEGMASRLNAHCSKGAVHESEPRGGGSRDRKILGIGARDATWRRDASRDDAGERGQGHTASRGEGSGARTGVPVRLHGMAEVGCSGFGLRKCTHLRDSGTRAEASYARTPRAHQKVSTSPRQRKEAMGQQGGVPPN